MDLGYHYGSKRQGAEAQLQEIHKRSRRVEAKYIIGHVITLFLCFFGIAVAWGKRGEMFDNINKRLDALEASDKADHESYLTKELHAEICRANTSQMRLDVIEALKESEKKIISEIRNGRGK